MAPESNMRPVSELLVTIEFEIVTTPVRVPVPTLSLTNTPHLLFDASQRSRLRSDPSGSSKPISLPDETLSCTVTLQKLTTSTPAPRLFSNRQCSTDAFRSPAPGSNTSPLPESVTVVSRIKH